MTPEQKLDKILKYLYDEYEKQNVQYEHSKTICHLAKLLVSDAEAYLILLKLNEDGYLDMAPSNQWSFQINYNGILFHRKGGYETELKDIERKRLKENIYNGITAVGATIAGLYAIWQFYIEFSKQFLK